MPIRFNLKTLHLLAGLILSAQWCPATEVLTSGERDFFENKIRPALVKHCYECHAADSKEVGGKLLLDTREGLRTGGESGPSVVVGDPDVSLLIQSLRYEDTEMPPDKPLPQRVIRDFENWVRMGAPDPHLPVAGDVTAEKTGE